MKQEKITAIVLTTGKGDVTKKITIVPWSLSTEYTVITESYAMVDIQYISKTELETRFNLTSEDFRKVS